MIIYDDHLPWPLSHSPHRARIVYILKKVAAIVPTVWHGWPSQAVILSYGITSSYPTWTISSHLPMHFNLLPYWDSTITIEESRRRWVWFLAKCKISPSLSFRLCPSMRECPRSDDQTMRNSCETRSLEPLQLFASHYCTIRKVQFFHRESWWDHFSPRSMDCQCSSPSPTIPERFEFLRNYYHSLHQSSQSAKVDSTIQNDHKMTRMMLWFCLPFLIVVC